MKLLTAALMLCVPSLALAAAPVVKNVVVTDITPGSFSLVFTTDVAASASARIFLDDRGVSTAGTARVEELPSQTSAAAAAHAAGVHKLRVTGLREGTVHYYQVQVTGDASALSALFPSSSPLTEVRTEDRVVSVNQAADTDPPVRNPLLLHSWTTSPLPALGALATAEVTGASSPVSGFVGDGVAPTAVALDLNNIFSAQQRAALPVAGGEQVRLRLVSGQDDVRTRAFRVPAPSPGAVGAPVPYDQTLELKAGWNLVSFQVEPADTTLASAFGAAWSSVVEVWELSPSGWRFKDRMTDGGDLDQITVNRGYFVLASGSASWNVSGGWAVDKVPLNQGWNLVGYRELTSVTADNASQGLVGAARAIWTFDAQAQSWVSYQAGVPVEVNDLLTLEPGHGYFVDMAIKRGW